MVEGWNLGVINGDCSTAKGMTYSVTFLSRILLHTPSSNGELLDNYQKAPGSQSIPRWRGKPVRHL